jgi:hypothetical protein
MFDSVSKCWKAEKAMNGLCGSFAIVGILVLAACADSGPTTQQQISQDINSSRWMSSDLLQVMPSDRPHTMVFENQQLVP